MTEILLIVVIIFLGGILYVLKDSFNQTIKGLEAINKKVDEIKNKNEK